MGHDDFLDNLSANGYFIHTLTKSCFVMLNIFNNFLLKFVFT